MSTGLITRGMGCDTIEVNVGNWGYIEMDIQVDEYNVQIDYDECNVQIGQDEYTIQIEY